MSNELVLQGFDLSKPQQAIDMAAVLQKFVKEKNLTSNIKGKEYPQVEAWQFAGSQLGLYPELASVEDLSKEGEIKYGAWVEVKRYSDGKVMSKGYALCSNKEGLKRTFDEYAICSMAQTRAEGKAFRMLLAWLMKAAGFEATPAEEMDFAEKRQSEPVKPQLSPVQFEKACDRISKGELDVYYKVTAEFKLNAKQEKGLKAVYDAAKK